MGKSQIVHNAQRLKFNLGFSARFIVITPLLSTVAKAVKGTYLGWG